MPTAARVVAAILLAILGFVASEQIKTLMPEGTGFGWFSVVNAGIGLLCGWWVLGSRAGRGWIAAINNGITGMAALVFWGLFVQGANQMVEDSLKRRFSDPLEAVAAVFENILKYGQVMLDTNLIFLLLLGAVIAGWLTEMAARNWR